MFPLAVAAIVIVVVMIGVALLWHLFPEDVTPSTTPVAPTPSTPVSGPKPILNLSQSDYNYAALGAIQDRVGGSWPSRAGVGLGYEEQHHVDRAKRIIAEFREWLPSQTDPKVVSAYKYWLNAAERDLREAQDAINSGYREKEKSRDEKFWADLRSKSQRAKATKLPRP